MCGFSFLLRRLYLLVAVLVVVVLAVVVFVVDVFLLRGLDGQYGWRLLFFVVGAAIAIEMLA